MPRPTSAPPPLPAVRNRWARAMAAAGPLAIVLWLALVGAALWLAVAWLDPTPDKQLVIATGPEQGAYAEFADRYLPHLRTHRLAVELRPTQGSAENLALLRDKASGVQAAFVQGGVDAVDARDRADLVSLGSVALEPVWFFYRDDSARRLLGGEALTRLSQLEGWRIHTGPEGGGTRPLFERLAEANGLEPGRMQLSASPTVMGVVELVNGRIDALVAVSAADAPLIQYLLRTPGVKLLDFGQAEAYARRFPFLRAVVLPRGMVDLAADEPPHDVHLVAATASLVARADLHPALVQLLVQAAREVHGQAGWFHAAGSLPSPRADELPLAAEAERFYRQGRPWLQRYLPFWLANFIDRMWFVLLPLLAALIPLSRVLPPLVTLRLRSRIYRWYAHLRAVEQALEQPSPDLAVLRARLEQIDHQVEHVGVPLPYANELYHLRSHIHLVRKRLIAAGAPATPPA